MFSAPARRVSLPLFARLHAGETGASDAFVPVCTLLLLVTLPACLVLAALARPIVQIVYGDTWLPAASVLPWLMVLALVRVVGELVYDFLVALGSSRSNLSLQVVWLAALAIALPIAARKGGIEAVAMAHAGVAVCIVVPTYAIVLHRAGVSLRAVASQVLRPLVATVAGGVVAVGVAVLIPDAFARLTLGAALIGLVYLAIVFPMRRLLQVPGAGRGMKPLVVMVPGNAWDGNRLGQHHLATHLAERAHVLWVDPPISYLTPLNDEAAAATLREDRLRPVAPGITRLSPVTVPGVTRPVLRELAQHQARRAVRRAVARLGGPVHSTIVASLHDMLDVVPGAQRVFFGTDDYVAGAALMGTDPRWLAQIKACRQQRPTS